MATRARVGSVAPGRARSPKGKGEHLRDEILAAAEKLLIKTGDVDAVSIRAIADAVGVTPPSLYLHFPDKDALMVAVCQKQFTLLEDRIGDATDDIADPLQRLRVMGDVYVRFGVDHPEQYRILLMTKGVFVREDFERGDAPGATTFLKLLTAVEDCMAAGAFRKDDPLLVATGIWSVIHGVTSLRIAMPTFPFVSEDAFLDHITGVHFRGLA